MSFTDCLSSIAVNLLINTLVSSANSLILDFIDVQFIMSLVYNINNKGPNTEPLVIPQLISCNSVRLCTRRGER